MDNLGALFQAAPTTAGFFLGQDQASQQAAAALKNQETLKDIAAKQQTYDFNQQNNPLLLQKQQTLNQGYTLDNTAKQQTNDENAATQSGRIAATNSSNDLKTLQNHITHSQQVEDFFNKAADQLKYMPPAMRGSWLASGMQANGIDPSNPQVQTLVQQASQNPDLLSQHAGEIAKERAARTADYIKAMDEQKSKNDSAAKVEGMRAAAQIKSSEIIAGGRVGAAKVRAGAGDPILSGKIKLPEQPAYFEQRASETDDPDEKAYFLAQARKANQLLLDRANAKPTNSVNNGEITTNTTKPVYGDQPAADPSHIDALINKYAK